MLSRFFQDLIMYVDANWDHAQHVHGIPLVRASVAPVYDTPALDPDGRLVMMRLPDTWYDVASCQAQPAISYDTFLWVPWIGATRNFRTT
jgi:hypothetical protein